MKHISSIISSLMVGFSLLTAQPSLNTNAADNTVIRPERELLFDTPVNPYQYGQFIEYLCDLVPGMWSEKVCDNSFEGLSPYNVAFRKQIDFREKPWYPVGAVHRGRYSLDSAQAFNGKVSQRIEVKGDEPCTLGLAQDGIGVEKGKALRLSAYLREKGISGSVRMYLRAGNKILSATKFSATEEWKKYTARLLPLEPSGNASLVVEFRGPGTIWIDQVSLMPERTVGGWRIDVVKALKELKPGIIRLGGSATETFDWLRLIGDPDKRPPWINLPWGGQHPTGAGLEEFVQLCRVVDAEPLICVRLTGRIPKNAADEVEYFNGSPETPMGMLRAANGHPAQYNVKFWQIGNELEGDEYERELPVFCRAMKAVDPTIKLLSSFPTPNIINTSGQYLDYVSPHHYECEDLAGKESEIRTIEQWLDSASRRNIKVAVTEWNTTAGDWGVGRGRLLSLDNALACARYHNFMHRHADIIEIANRSNLTNSFCSGIIQTDNLRLYKTPTYYVQQLYAHHAGIHPLRVTLEGKMDRDDVSATMSRGKVSLLVVNSTLHERRTLVDLSAFGTIGGTVHVWKLVDTKNAGERDVLNSFEEPERVRLLSSQFVTKSAKFPYAFPPLSVVALECTIKD
ncbi:MAG: alpha-L-arabinofuranosidase C-terminal domain-containing protein [Bacteroidota bacterium]|jgi:alpha-N-arabinofuranosidase